ncbi:thiamine-phosphate pyrophosphorylase [bacterium]|nr:thiamine-phosphate pyrophosphorylase [bacterium]
MRPLPAPYWLAAACHNAAELQRAMAIGCDFVTLAPVCATQTHPGIAGMGWTAFQQLTQIAAPLPIYALGGLAPSDLALAQAHGAFGVAGISAFWPQ